MHEIFFYKGAVKEMERQVIGDKQQGLGGIALTFDDLQGVRDEWEGNIWPKTGF